MAADDKNTNKEAGQNLLEHYNEAKLVRKIVTVITTTVLLLILIIGGGGYLYIKSALKPLDANSKISKKVNIPIGSSVTSIADELKTKGIIKNAKVFKYYVKLKNEAGFMAGDYELSPSMDVAEIVSRLKTGKVLKQASFKVTFPEGQQLKEIAQVMAKVTHKSDNEVLTILNDPAFIHSMMTKYPNLLTKDILNPSVKYPLEGYLYPATYSFYKTNPSVQEMAEAMLQKTQNVLANYDDERKKKNLTIHQLLTMSSLIEQEATAKADRKKLQVFSITALIKGCHCKPILRFFMRKENIRKKSFIQI